MFIKTSPFARAAAALALVALVSSCGLPRTGPNNCPIVSSQSSAMRDRSRMSPMKVKKGIASNVSLRMTSNMRFALACSRFGNSRIWSGAKTESSTPRKKNIKPPAASVKATG